MSNDSGLILPNNYMPRVGERQMFVAKKDGLVFVVIQDAEGKDLERATLTGEETAMLVKNLIEAHTGEEVRIDINGRKVVN